MAVAPVSLAALQNNLPAALPEPAAQDKSQASGDIYILGDALYVHWAFDDTNDTLDVRLKTIFGISLAHAGGEVDNDDVKIDGGFDVGIAKGDVTVEAVWKDIPGGRSAGLWLETDLTVLGKQYAHSESRIVSW